MNKLAIMKVSGLIKVLSGLILFLPMVCSAEINLKFIDGKKFTDYEVTGQSRSKSLVTVEKDLNKLLTKLSNEYLKDKQVLEIEVTNIDLPGIYRYAIGPQHQDIRVIEYNRTYRLNFKYRLKNSSGKILKEGTHKLKEQTSLSLVNRINSHSGTVGYYKKPLQKWFKTSFQTKEKKDSSS